MKTENTPQEKAKFFAQYWGQFLKTSDNHKTKGLKPLEIDSHSIQYVDEHSFLELTPLKNISYEDAIEVARIALNKDINWGREFSKKLAGEFGLIRIEIPDSYKSKDFSDLVYNTNPETAKDLIVKMLTPF